MTAEVIIENIRHKIERLIEDNRNLAADYDKVCRQRDALRADNRALKEQIASMERRISTLEIAGSLEGGTTDKKAAKARINRLMREVDKCIALLNRAENV